MFLGLSGVVAGLIIPEVVISSKAELEYKVRELEVSVRSLQVQQTGD